MEIISLYYLVFCIIFFCLFFLLPKHGKRIIILLFSYFFYGSISIFLLTALFISTLFNFFIVKLKLKNKYLISVIFNISLLLLFKLGVHMKHQTIFLPIGISFFTFQAISFSLDHKANKIANTIKFLDFANYLSFFPQLISGPIERFENLVPQLRTFNKFSWVAVQNGLYLILIGLCKKLIISDRLGFFVDSVYEDLNQSNGYSIIIATILFYFQIFLDFSGYCNIAIGISKIMGIELSSNFNRPYLSSSISSYWRRWHTTLHLWFKEYIYTHLKERYNWIISAFIIFFLSGLWHGVNYTFALWGIFCFLTLLIDKWIIQKIIPFKILRILTTALLIISSRFFYRVERVEDLLIIYSNISNFKGFNIVFRDILYVLNNFTTSNLNGTLSLGSQNIQISYLDLFIMIISVLFWGIITIINVKSDKKLPKITGIFLMIILLSFFGFNGHKPFIYLQF